MEIGTIYEIRDGRYKIQSGELIRVCMSSDFFAEGADEWRDDAWEIMRQRPERVREHLPSDRGGDCSDCGRCK